jgi:transcriptional regulator with PAS, ATPase and Fis domain
LIAKQFVNRQKSPAMTKALEVAAKVARHPSPVLITGESGTGKELVARLIHGESDRADAAFVPLNCGAIPENLLESELFGYVRGAFTGATANKKGLLEAANCGVLFLDEVGEMPLDLQKKLLRVLQEGEVRPIGSRETIKVDVRLICATNRNLEAMVRDGEFREDLYYRLAVLPVHLPPLRDRREDIPPLVKRFLSDLQRDQQTRVRISPDAMERIAQYDWPGNVREGRRGPGLSLADDGLVPSERGTTLPDMVRELEVREIQKAFDRAQSNKSRAADLLGLSRFALQRKLDKYALDGTGRPNGAVPTSQEEDAE